MDRRVCVVAVVGVVGVASGWVAGQYRSSGSPKAVEVGVGIPLEGIDRVLLVSEGVAVVVEAVAVFHGSGVHGGAQIVAIGGVRHVVQGIVACDDPGGGIPESVPVQVCVPCAHVDGVGLVDLVVAVVVDPVALLVHAWIDQRVRVVAIAVPHGPAIGVVVGAGIPAAGVAVDPARVDRYIGGHAVLGALGVAARRHPGDRPVAVLVGQGRPPRIPEARLAQGVQMPQLVVDVEVDLDLDLALDPVVDQPVPRNPEAHERQGVAGIEPVWSRWIAIDGHGRGLRLLGQQDHADVINQGDVVEVRMLVVVAAGEPLVVAEPVVVVAPVQVHGRRDALETMRRRQHHVG